MRDNVSIIRHRCNTAVRNEEYSDTAEYPPILDVGKKATKKRERQAWFDLIKSRKTVEEKLFEINLPKYYGWWTVLMENGRYPYNSLPFSQHITRTHIVQGLPSSYHDNLLDEKVDRVFDKIKPQILNAVSFAFLKYREKPEEGSDIAAQTESHRKMAKCLIHQINHIIMSNLSQENNYLLESQVDFVPKVEAFWFAGGVGADKRLINQRKRRGLTDEEAKSMPHEVPCQYISKPVLQVRCQDPLPSIIDQNSPGEEAEVPQFPYEPRVAGYRFSFRYGRNIPGFWPGDQCEFGLLSYHTSEHLIYYSHQFKGKDPYQEERLHCQGILASYAWLLSQACYQGFSTFHELTYPLTTQTVITNGQTWSLYAYQLNTTLVHSDFFEVNPLKNVCWASPEMKLFESVSEGKPVGFNDEVLRMLLKFYLNKPHVREGVVLKPYLGARPYLSDVSDDYKRKVFHERFKFMYRFPPPEMPEIYNWEKIYKVYHKTRPMDARRRFFELGIDPSKRHYDDRPRKYKPKALRLPNEIKLKSYERKTKKFYPLVTTPVSD